MARNISKQLSAIVAKMGTNFSLHNSPVSYEDIFSEVGLLPAIARRADQLCSLCLGYGIGANFEEADGTLTKKDFINKTGIARKEAKETRYWLLVISGTYIDSNSIAVDVRESEEIINILSSILINPGYRRRQ